MTLKSNPPCHTAMMAGLYASQRWQGKHCDKRMAEALRVHPQTARKMRKGHGWTPAFLDKLYAIGGSEMATFIYGRPPEDDLSGLRKELLAVTPNIVRLHQSDQVFWCDDSGSLHHAAHGSLEFVKRVVGVTATEHFAHRMMGWVSISIRPDFTADIRYTEGQGNKAAVSRACAFLIDEGRKSLRTVRRVVDCGGEWVAAVPASPEEAANALMVSARMGAPYLVVNHLSLDVANDHPEFRAILSECTDATGVAWAAALRHMPEQASYVDIRGDDVTLAVLGPDLKLPQGWTGKNIMTLPGMRFADMTRHYMRMARDGFVLRDVQAPFGNEQVHYLNLSGPDGKRGGDGGVFSATIVKKRERIAA